MIEVNVASPLAKKAPSDSNFIARQWRRIRDLGENVANVFGVATFGANLIFSRFSRADWRFRGVTISIQCSASLEGVVVVSRIRCCFRKILCSGAGILSSSAGILISSGGMLCSSRRMRGAFAGMAPHPWFGGVPPAMNVWRYRRGSATEIRPGDLP